MNLTWHIIKKDLCLIRWHMVIGALLGIYVLGLGRSEFSGTMPWGYNGVVSFMALFVMPLFLLNPIFESDLVMPDTMFWRTRPISPGRLLLAKFSTTMIVGVITPCLVVIAGMGPHPIELWWTAMSQIVLLQTVAMLLILGASACSYRYDKWLDGPWVAPFPGFVAVLFILQASFLTVEIPENVRCNIPFPLSPIDRPFTLQIWVLCAVGLIINQYFARRVFLSGILVAMALFADFGMRLILR